MAVSSWLARLLTKSHKFEPPKDSTVSSLTEVFQHRLLQFQNRTLQIVELGKLPTPSVMYYLKLFGGPKVLVRGSFPSCSQHCSPIFYNPYPRGPPSAALGCLLLISVSNIFG